MHLQTSRIFPEPKTEYEKTELELQYAWKKFVRQGCNTSQKGLFE